MPWRGQNHVIYHLLVKFIVHALFNQVSFNSHYLDVQESVYMFMILSLLATH